MLATIWILTSIWVFWITISKNLKIGGKKIVLVWDNASYHISSKEKNYTKIRSRGLNALQDH